jgi:hypothetical protein
MLCEETERSVYRRRREPCPLPQEGRGREARARRHTEWLLESSPILVLHNCRKGGPGRAVFEQMAGLERNLRRLWSLMGCCSAASKRGLG